MQFPRMPLACWHGDARLSSVGCSALLAGPPAPGMVPGRGVPGEVVTAPSEAMAKATKQTPPPLPAVDAAVARSVQLTELAAMAERVADILARKLTGVAVPVVKGDTLTTGGVTFRSPVTGQLKQGKKLNCGWPLIAEGTKWFLVPGTFLPEGAPEGTVPVPAHVIVSRVPAEEGRMGKGGKGGNDGIEWKAWPYTTCTVVQEGGAA